MFANLLDADRLTLVIAPVVGAYLLASGLGLARVPQARAFLADLRDHPGTMHAVGAIAFFVGAAILSFNRNWDTPVELTVNLVASWWLFEGAGMLASPALMARFFDGHGAEIQLRLASLVGLPIGAFLILAGVFGSTA